MSQKNSREAKKRRRVMNGFSTGTPTYIDLVEYVRLRTGCTRTIAERVLLAGALMVDSHPVGYKWERNRKVLDPFLKAEFRDRIVVKMPKELTEDN